VLAGQNNQRYVVDAGKWYERGIQKRQKEEAPAVKRERMSDPRRKRIEELQPIPPRRLNS
jgi:uncharacterized protein YbaA (DUF1428 family)